MPFVNEKGETVVVFPFFMLIYGLQFPCHLLENQ
jgi:hypothetical protein